MRKTLVAAGAAVALVLVPGTASVTGLVATTAGPGRLLGLSLAGGAVLALLAGLGVWVRRAVARS